MDAFSCSELSVGYGGRAVATGISFSLPVGSSLAIIGSNGSGKSTLLKTLAALLPPVSGELSVEPQLAAGGIGYLPQQKQSRRNFPASVFEVVLSGRLGFLGFRPFYSRADKEAAASRLRLAGLLELAGSPFRELSGGQQQRVLIARALCAAKKALLLDEPVTGLDEASAEQLNALLNKLNKEEGITLATVTHDRVLGLTGATHILALGGSRQFFGDIKAYRAYLKEAGADD